MKKLIVISADALVAEDMEYLETLPNFKKYLGGWWSECVKCIRFIRRLHIRVIRR